MALGPGLKKLSFVWTQVASKSNYKTRITTKRYSEGPIHCSECLAAAAAAAARSLQSCLTLCDHIDGSPPGSPVPGIHGLPFPSPMQESEK